MGAHGVQRLSAYGTTVPVRFNGRIRLSKWPVRELQLPAGSRTRARSSRVGLHVLHPSSPHSGSIHAFVWAVRQDGFEGAPIAVGINEDGRERLVFIDREVPVPPYDHRYKGS